MPDSRRLGVPFLRVLGAHTVSQLGQGTYLVAVPLIAASLTSDPRIVAALAVASSVPALVLALPIGSLVDRAPRVRLMVGSDVLCALALGAVSILTVMGALSIPALIVASTILGVAQLLVATASFAVVPAVVPHPELTRANGYLAVGGETAAGVAGPPLGGVLVAVSPFLATLLAAATSVFSAALLIPLARARAQAPTAQEPKPPTTPARRRRHELLAGLAYLRDHPTLGATTALSAAFGLFAWMPEATLVLFARETLHLSPPGFGLLLAVTAIGAIVGGITLAPLTASVGTARLVVLSHLIYGALLIPVGLTDNAWVVGAVFFLQGIPLIASDAAVRSLQQTLTPDDLLGRVGAVNRLAGGVSTSVGLAAGGLLAHEVGYSAVWVVAGLACTGIPLALARRTLAP